MLIANPLYDVVFKFLMEDPKSAKLLLSAILGVEIISLKFRPTESTSVATKEDEKDAKGPQALPLRPYFQDFSAKIKTSEGSKLVILEVQKTHINTNSFRFRTYLGLQYGNKDNYHYVTNQKGKSKKHPVPIIGIFFLGHDLENIKGVPVIKVNREYLDVFAGKTIPQRDPFIESLTHDSYFICVKALKGQQRSELEALLGVFDQSKKIEDPHFLQIEEKNLPAKYQPIMRRLHLATKDRELLMEMLYQDAVMEEWDEYIQMHEDEVKKLRKKVEKTQLKLEEKIKASEQRLLDALQKASEIEQQRQAAEQQIKLFEQERMAAEQQKLEAEQQKLEAEQQKLEAEQQKLEAEQQKQIFEQQKLEAEQQKQLAEQQRLLAEQEKLAIMIRAAKTMHEQGWAIAMIAQTLGIQETRVTQWLAEKRLD
jgi:hypothetical protein